MKKFIFLLAIAMGVISCNIAKNSKPLPPNEYVGICIVAVDENGTDLLATGAINYMDVRYDMYDASGNPIVIDGSYKEGEGPSGRFLLLDINLNGKEMLCRTWNLYFHNDVACDRRYVIKWDANNSDEFTFENRADFLSLIVKHNGVEVDYYDPRDVDGDCMEALIVRVFPTTPKD